MKLSYLFVTEAIISFIVATLYWFLALKPYFDYYSYPVLSEIILPELILLAPIASLIVHATALLVGTMIRQHKSFMMAGWSLIVLGILSTYAINLLGWIALIGFVLFLPLIVIEIGYIAYLGIAFLTTKRK